MSRMPLNNAPEESSGGPNDTSGGLSMRKLSVKGSFPVFPFLSDLDVGDSFRCGLPLSFELRRCNIVGHSMSSIPGDIALAVSPKADQGVSRGKGSGTLSAGNITWSCRLI